MRETKQCFQTMKNVLLSDTVAKIRMSYSASVNLRVQRRREVSTTTVQLGGYVLQAHLPTLSQI